MTRFAMVAATWVLLAAAATPLLVEAMDQRGYSLAVAGLPVTVSEILLGVVVAFGPVVLAAVWRAKRERS